MNLFDFANGEATVTIDNVTYTYNLPIKGKFVIDHTFSDIATVDEVYIDLLRKRLISFKDYVGLMIKYTWLFKKKFQTKNEVKV